jgi:hypothetical protein
VAKPKILNILDDIETRFNTVDLEFDEVRDTAFSEEKRQQLLEREVANLKLLQGASDRIPNGNLFGSSFTNEFGMTLDKTKTSVVGTTLTSDTLNGLSAAHGVLVGDLVENSTRSNTLRLVSTVPTTEQYVMAEAIVGQQVGDSIRHYAYGQLLDAQLDTSETTLIIASHGLAVGDYVINVTRGDAIRRVNSVTDENTVEIDAVSSQSINDDIRTYTFVRTFVLSGATVVPVLSATGFVVGQEVTIYDDVNHEDVDITAINGNNLTVSVLTKSYKDKAQVARSMVANDGAFGGWATETTQAVTDATVVARADNITGNGGRKISSNSNGIFFVTFSSTIFYLHKRNPVDGVISTVFTSGAFGSAQDSSIIATDKNVYISLSGNNNSFQVYRFNPITGVLVDFSSLDNATQTAMGSGSLAINDTGTELHATWASKNATYANSFNIRYAKGTINADGSVAWGAVVQKTTFNTSTYNLSNASIILNNIGEPLIITDYAENASKLILALGKGTSTSASISGNYSIIYNGSTYVQSSPSAIFVPQSVNGLTNGRIWVAWHGTDATDNAAHNIRVSYSDDGGVTWSAMQKLTTGNASNMNFGSITASRNNAIFIVFQNGSVGGIRKISNNGSWSTITDVLPSTNAPGFSSTLYDPNFNFTEPLFIYKNNAKVGFYGTWTVGSEAPLANNTIRFNTEREHTEVATFIQHDSDITVIGENMTRQASDGAVAVTITEVV